MQGGGLLHLLGNDLAQSKVKAVCRIAVHTDKLNGCPCGGARYEVFEQAQLSRLFIVYTAGSLTS